MQKISRRRLLQYSTSLAASTLMPWSVPAQAKQPPDVYMRRDELPVLELDVESLTQKFSCNSNTLPGVWS